MYYINDIFALVGCFSAQFDNEVPISAAYHCRRV